jgi:hypothetical protein
MGEARSGKRVARVEGGVASPRATQSFLAMWETPDPLALAEFGGGDDGQEGKCVGGSEGQWRLRDGNPSCVQEGLGRAKVPSIRGALTGSESGWGGGFEVGRGKQRGGGPRPGKGVGRGGMGIQKEADWWHNSETSTSVCVKKVFAARTFFVGGGFGEIKKREGVC